MGRSERKNIHILLIERMSNVFNTLLLVSIEATGYKLLSLKFVAHSLTLTGISKITESLIRNAEVQPDCRYLMGD